MQRFLKLAILSLTLGLFLPITAGATSVQVSATVIATRTIVVDQQSSITAIYSNTHDNVAPVIRLQSLQGEVVPTSPTIAQNLKRIRPFINYQPYGQVYAAGKNPELLFLPLTLLQ